LIDQGALGAYEAALADWQGRLRQQVISRAGRYLLVRSDAGLNRLQLHDWRRLGLINRTTVKQEWRSWTARETGNSQPELRLT
jgi:hypothetical protein